MSTIVEKKFRIWQPFVIVMSLFALFLIPKLFQDPMPRAGLENGIVASRLIPGETPFWELTNDATLQELDEIAYMPLGYWMESVAMHFFGDSTYFDVWYSFAFFIIAAILLFFTWINLGNAPRSFWVPMLLYLVVPIILRSSTANYIEMPFTVILLLSTLIYVRGISKTLRDTGHGEHAEMRKLSNPSRKYTFGRAFNMIWVGLMLSTGFMIKGVTGIFPIILPFLVWCLDPNRKGNWRPFLDLGIIVTVMILLNVILILIDPAMPESIRAYRVSLRSGALAHSTSVASHFYILYQALVQLLIPIAVCFLVFIPKMLEHKLKKYAFYWKYQDDLSNSEVRLITIGHACMITGFVGIVVSSYSLRQYDYYILPTLPYFIMGLACYSVQSSELMLSKVTKLSSTLLSIVGFVFPVAAILMFMNAMFSSRDNGSAVSELHRMLPYLEQNENVGVGQSVMPNSVEALHMRRHRNVTLQPDKFNRHLLLKFDEYYRLPRKNDFKEVELGNSIYHLYECANPALLGKGFYDRDLPPEVTNSKQQVTDTAPVTDTVKDHMRPGEEFVDPMYIRRTRAAHEAALKDKSKKDKPKSGTDLERQMIHKD